jgi:hypothetical protein
MPALGQLWTGPAEPPPARGVLATAPFEDHTLAAHHDVSYPVICDLRTDNQPERHSAELLSIFVDVFAESWQPTQGAEFTMPPPFATLLRKGTAGMPDISCLSRRRRTLARIAVLRCDTAIGEIGGSHKDHPGGA